MDRQLRFKVPGILFYLVLLINILLTEDGWNSFDSILTAMLKQSASSASSIVSLVSVLLAGGTAIFTSDAIGYLFGSVVNFVWQVLRADILQWHIVKFDPRKHLRTLNIEEEDSFRRDVVFNYLWQQNSEPLVQWAVRRDNAFVTGMSSALAILTAIIASILMSLSFSQSLTWTGSNTCFILACAVPIVILFWNGILAGIEGWQLMRLWYLANDGKPIAPRPPEE